MILYYTIERESEITQVIERSKFIACAAPVLSREEAEAFFAGRKALHKTATHNVPAFVIGDKSQLQWASDDGEPQGTSGAPIVQMLTSEGVTNVAVMVTRYFGGIKLGTGGLVRAYTGAAREALHKGGVCGAAEQMRIAFRLDYAFHGKLLNLAQNGLFSLANEEFTDKVTVELLTDPENEGEVMTLLSNLTSGTGELLSKHDELTKRRI
ncbi:MAG: IMPACT family protein [Clostridiales Family XIII bacterium]|jgi:uncharacterized YigZ family protein|nr:IMPACT family protein [Clostridiales Family XIII bacterium]